MKKEKSKCCNAPIKDKNSILYSDKSEEELKEIKNHDVCSKCGKRIE